MCDRRQEAGFIVLSLHGILSAFVLFALVACSQQAGKPHPVYYDQAHGGRVFQVAYDHFDALYIEDLDLGQFTMTGLENLAFLDTRITVRARDGMIEILGDEEKLVALERPRSNNPVRWAKVTSEAISTMQMASSVIAANTAEEIYEVFFDSTLEELDDYTRYAGRADAREHRATREGFGGIGVRINVVEEGVLIIDVMEATPAEQAGLKIDDLIVAVDGKSLVGLDQPSARSACVQRAVDRGAAGVRSSLADHRHARSHRPADRAIPCRGGCRLPRGPQLQPVDRLDLAAQDDTGQAGAWPEAARLCA